MPLHPSIQEGLYPFPQRCNPLILQRFWVSPDHLGGSRFYCLWSRSFVWLQYGVKTTNFSSATTPKYSLIVVVFSSLFSFAHTTQPAPSDCRRKGWEATVHLKFIPNIAQRHPNLASHSWLAEYRGFTRQTVFEKDTSTVVSPGWRLKGGEWGVEKGWGW